MSRVLAYGLWAPGPSSKRSTPTRLPADDPLCAPNIGCYSSLNVVVNSARAWFQQYKSPPMLSVFCPASRSASPMLGVCGLASFPLSNHFYWSYNCNFVSTELFSISGFTCVNFCSCRYWSRLCLIHLPVAGQALEVDLCELNVTHLEGDWIESLGELVESYRAVT